MVVPYRILILELAPVPLGLIGILSLLELDFKAGFVNFEPNQLPKFKNLIRSEGSLAEVKML